MITLNRRRYMGKKGLLPSGYTQVEYLETTGTQYINTGVVLDKVKSEVYIDFKKLNSGNYVSLMGCQSSVGNFNLRQTYFYYGFQELRFYNSTRSSYYTFYLANNVRHSIHTIVDSNNSVILYIDGSIYTTTLNAANADNTLPLFLFANNTDGLASQKISAQIYNIRIKDDADILVFNGIPCLRNSDNKPGMYDLVTNTFFTNQGTGEFLYGNPV